jgi:beta-alanine--pyruvate transaminase
MTAAVRPPLSNRDDAFWMPFTASRQFHRNPMIFTGAEGMYYIDDQGRRVLDGMAGLWCVNAGHGQPRIAEAIAQAARGLDFVSSFRMSHPAAFHAAERLTALAPAGLNHAFFTNSGSESVDTALKIARAYHQVRGDGRRTKLVGRVKGYHGMGFGGLSVSGIGRHKRDFGPLLADTDHLPLPYDGSMAFSRGQPERGAAYADALDTIAQVQDPGTIAAVIVEPVTGSGGVYPPPQGYLARLREICDRHGILLIFDEVITGFGRLGATFASEAFGVMPDLASCAKGLTNGAVPMGAVLVRDTIFEGFMAGPEEAIELFHGYTYSAHPLACAAALATFELHAELGLNARAAAMAPIWESALHTLQGARHVVDVRTAGILGAIELAARPAAAGARGSEAAQACFEAGVLVRSAGDALVLSPPLIVSETEIGQIVDTIRKAVSAID